MFDKDYLTGILNDENLAVDDKISQIIAEHEASERGLVTKRDELLGSEKKLKEQIKAFGEKESGYNTTIAELQETIKKNNPEDTKKYYESQLAIRSKEFDEKYSKLSEERDYYKSSHLKRLQDDAIADGIKDLQFVDGLKDGFIFTVLGRNKFEPREIDGNTVFLSSDNKTIQEKIKEFSLSSDGKAYLKALNTGSGANSSNGFGNSYKNSSSTNSNSGEFNREEYVRLSKINPNRAIEYAKQFKK